MEFQADFLTDQPNPPIKIFLVMGVCGCGKSTVAKQLTDHYPNSYFIEADDFHPDSNKQKMKKGIPLNDEDRLPWLKTLANEIIKTIKKIRSTKNSQNNLIFFACSALKRTYRDLLKQQVFPHGTLVLLYLHISSVDELMKRVSGRKGHFMSSSLVESQLSALEIPDDSEQPCIKLDVLKQTSDQILITSIKAIDKMNESVNTFSATKHFNFNLK